MKLISIISAIARVAAATWLSFMGLIASIMLYSEVFAPEWSQVARSRIPEEPEWYILALVLVSALACFYISYILMKPLCKRPAGPRDDARDDG